MTKHIVLYYDISKFSLIHRVGGKEVTFKSPMLLVLIASPPEYAQISHHFGVPLTIVVSQLQRTGEIGYGICDFAYIIK